MRFPWLQVDADFIGAKASDLGALLGISRREAMGLALDLWTWALARARDDAPPDGLVTGTGTEPDRLLSGAVGWTGSVEDLPRSLVAVGLAERVDNGYRLTGVGRYKATWEKNRRRTGAKPERNRTGAGVEPARKTQTQTQTQTHIETPSGREACAPLAPEAEELPAASEHAEEELEPEVEAHVDAVLSERPPLVLEAPRAEKPARKQPPGEALYERMESIRREFCEEAGVPFIPSRWTFGRQNKDLGPIAKLPEGNTDKARFEAAWREFMEDPKAAILDEPFSLGFFWTQRSRYEGKALRVLSGGAS